MVSLSAKEQTNMRPSGGFTKDKFYLFFWRALPNTAFARH